MALSIPQILRQFKTDVAKAVSSETITKICGYLPGPAATKTWPGKHLPPLIFVSGPKSPL